MLVSLLVFVCLFVCLLDCLLNCLFDLLILVSRYSGGGRGAYRVFQSLAQLQVLLETGARSGEVAFGASQHAFVSVQKRAGQGRQTDKQADRQKGRKGVTDK